MQMNEAKLLFWKQTTESLASTFVCAVQMCSLEKVDFYNNIKRRLNGLYGTYEMSLNLMTCHSSFYGFIVFI